MIKFVPLGKWIGLDTLGAEEFEKLRPGSEAAILRACLHYEGAVKRKLSGKRSGRIYRIGKRGIVHQASAPGEPPAVLLGRLRNSITHVVNWDGDNVSGEVGTNVVYAPILEFGGVTWNGGRILPRPFMEPTFLEEEDRIQQILEGAAEVRSTGAVQPTGRLRDAKGRFIKAEE